MKKRKLKGWVKITLFIIAILLLSVINRKMTNDAINTCVKNNQDINICENLRK